MGRWTDKDVDEDLNKGHLRAILDWLEHGESGGGGLAGPEPALLNEVSSTWQPQP